MKLYSADKAVGRQGLVFPALWSQFRVRAGYCYEMLLSVEALRLITSGIPFLGFNRQQP